tara:strand:- start:15970 stop:16710 length:741 start_codon:yes stop_codon:yes gene_type:complete
MASEYDIGLDWWNAQNSDNPGEYWSNLLEENELTPGFNNPNPFGNLGYLMGMPNLTQSLSAFEIDPYSHYTATETADIQKDLYDTEFTTMVKPSESFKRGATGLASSGYNPRTDIFSDYKTRIEEIEESSQNTLDNLYSGLGQQITSVFDTYMDEGGSLTEYGVGDLDTYISDFYDDNIPNWTSEFAADIMIDSGLMTEEEIGSMYVESIDECIQNELSSLGSTNPSDYLIAMNTCTASQQYLGDQ